jgi:hypothetical protein
MCAVVYGGSNLQKICRQERIYFSILFFYSFLSTSSEFSIRLTPHYHSLSLGCFTQPIAIVTATARVITLQRVNRASSSALRSLRSRVRGSQQCGRRLHAALHRFPGSKVLLHRNSWLSTQQSLCRLVGAHIPKLQQQGIAVPTLSDATTWRMLVNDNSLVAWYSIKKQCPVRTLTAVVLQREQLPVWYRRLISTTVQELMSEMFARA